VRSSHLLAVAITCLASTASLALAQPADRSERAAVSSLLALGRLPAAADVAAPAGEARESVADLVARHRRLLQDDPAARRKVAAKAALDALGTAAGGGETGDDLTYAELVQRHTRWLAGHPGDYEAVIQRAYRAVLQRDAYTIEIDYWKNRPVISFVLLAGCVENWAQRNQPGLMATTGTPTISVNSRFLATLRLSPAMAAEARTAIGEAAVGERSVAAAVGRHVVAPGAGSIESVGGVHFAAVGGDRLAPASPTSAGQ
jgi:hypothetical protein